MNMWSGILTLEIYARTWNKHAMEQVLTRFVQNGISLSFVKVMPNDNIQIDIRLADYWKIRHLVRASGCGWRIKRRKGLAFVPRLIMRHFFFLLGAGLFLATLLVLNAIVWQVEVTGPTKLSHQHILAIAKQEGIYKGQWKANLTESDYIATQIEKKMPEAAWVGIRFIGSHAYIRVVDRTVQAPPAILPNRHITATHDAVITEITATKGTPVVQPNDHVIRGTILISGIVGDEEHHATVAAEGVVRGLVWYTQTIEVPLKTSYIRLLGPHKQQTYLMLFDRKWKLKGYKQKKYKQQKTIQKKYNPSIWGITIPIPLMKQTQWQIETVNQTHTVEQARSIALAEAERNLLRQIGEKATITRRKLLHENRSDGKVYIKVHVEVDQEIMKETEIIERTIDR